MAHYSHGFITVPALLPLEQLPALRGVFRTVLSNASRIPRRTQATFLALDQFPYLTIRLGTSSGLNNPPSYRQIFFVFRGAGLLSLHTFLIQRELTDAVPWFFLSLFPISRFFGPSRLFVLLMLSKVRWDGSTWVPVSGWSCAWLYGSGDVGVCGGEMWSCGLCDGCHGRTQA